MLQFFDATNVYQVDSYSMLIVSKYFKTTQDFINVICVCKKFKETTEKLRFNPIPIKSLKLFPKIQTQYLYSKHDVMLKGVENFEAYYVIDYKQYLKLKGNNINFHHIKYTKYNRMSYGLEIPINVKELGESCYSCCNCITFTIPTQITSIELDCFSYNTKLINITLPKYLTKISNNCFSNCYSLTSITIPLSIESIHNYSFNECINLQSINLPNSITSIGNYCFF
ncbi:Leucine rich repeat protein [Entamoeba marina]